MHSVVKGYTLNVLYIYIHMSCSKLEGKFKEQLKLLSSFFPSGASAPLHDKYSVFSCNSRACLLNMVSVGSHWTKNQENFGKLASIFAPLLLILSQIFSHSSRFVHFLLTKLSVKLRSIWKVEHGFPSPQFNFHILPQHIDSAYKLIKNCSSAENTCHMEMVPCSWTHLSCGNWSALIQ